MTPILDARRIDAWAFYNGDAKTYGGIPPMDFNYWEESLTATAEVPDVGQCQAFAFQASEFYPTYIHASGHTWAAWSGEPSGTYWTQSICHILFQVDTCVVYSMNSSVDPGDSQTPAHARLIDAATNKYILDRTGGSGEDTGRLGPGQYVVEGNSTLRAADPSLDGGTYSILWTCLPCIQSLIAHQPGDLAVGCGGTAVIPVTATPPASGVTYQWRRDLVPLANTSHVSGVTTSTLTISNACDADAGYYDVVLSDGTVVEPSRQAHLTITAVTAVEDQPGPPSPLLVQAAGPNPFQTSTSFRYHAAETVRARIAIYSASGAKVRTLWDGPLTGSGLLSWDGRTASGTRAPAGIYFLRAEAGTLRESRKIVLLK